MLERGIFPVISTENSSQGGCGSIWEKCKSFQTVEMGRKCGVEKERMWKKSWNVGAIFILDCTVCGIGFAQSSTEVFTAAVAAAVVLSGITRENFPPDFSTVC